MYHPCIIRLGSAKQDETGRKTYVMGIKNTECINNVGRCKYNNDMETTQEAHTTPENLTPVKWRTLNIPMLVNSLNQLSTP